MADHAPVQTPVIFPLPEVAPQDRDRLIQAWATYDLERYLVRWQKARVPAIPEEFLAFSWRACDIGCGMGRYIIEQSRHNPKRAFLGIDKGVRRSAILNERTRTASRPNLFAMQANVTPVLNQLPDKSLDAITIFYPNPWWPTKHRKKRWSYHPLFPKLIELLKPGGSLCLCANEAFYLSEWVFALTHHDAAGSMEVAYQGPIQAVRGRTHFEAKFLQTGIQCGEIIAIKRG